MFHLILDFDVDRGLIILNKLSEILISNKTIDWNDLDVNNIKLFIMDENSSVVIYIFFIMCVSLRRITCFYEFFEHIGIDFFIIKHIIHSIHPFFDNYMTMCYFIKKPFLLGLKSIVFNKIHPNPFAKHSFKKITLNR